jgi:hypothetical protein
MKVELVEVVLIYEAIWGVSILQKSYQLNVRPTDGDRVSRHEHIRGPGPSAEDGVVLLYLPFVIHEDERVDLLISVGSA